MNRINPRSPGGSSALKRKSTDPEYYIVMKNRRLDNVINSVENNQLGPEVHPERPNGLKRKRTEPEYWIVRKKQKLDNEENCIKNIHLRPEVTLTLISKNSGSTAIKEIYQDNINIPNSFDESYQEACDESFEKLKDEKVEETSVNLTRNNDFSYLENYKEINLTRINRTGSIKVLNQDELHNLCLPDEVHAKDSEACSQLDESEAQISTKLVADLPEVSIEPCTSNAKAKISESKPKKRISFKKIQASLERAAEVLKQQEAENEIATSYDLVSYNKDGNLILSTIPVNDEIISDQTTYPEVCSSLFEEPQTPISTSTTATTACDYDPFSYVGIPVEIYWSKDKPYYAHGLPNPATENRCWINATLQVLFRLPVFNDLSLLDISNSSKLIRSLESIQYYWKRGMTRNYAYNTSFHHFKEELSILDEGYSSKAQQDVSEFLMNLLNFIKTEFETKSKESHSNEIENIPNNEQDTPRKSQSTSHDLNKRSPLADISASTGQSRSSHVTNNEQQEKGSTKTLSSPKSQNDKAEARPNVIDDNFLLYMGENYSCLQCSKKKQKNIENLMLLIDLPSKDCDGTRDLIDMINTTYDTEQRELTCESCKHDRHTMDTKLKKIPKILMAQVKRYEMTNEGIINKKSTEIDIPRLLQLDRLVIQNDSELSLSPSYEPVGIISHIGDSIDSGHYISFVKHKDEWFCYDDANVKILSEDEVFKFVQTNAYVIFFQETESCKNSNVTAEQKKGNNICY
ncbi:uncharacterized protein LOC106645861 [Copidosoma floridanum]|uniref:uncharacterized protein LOC106645861 n=1 Tax=Copidosoma floridanum TaxID=29053 RepID=UPI000C6F51B1|nr:uncharacterized protein LOC106645861 [Copidosoma floridanum]